MNWQEVASRFLDWKFGRSCHHLGLVRETRYCRLMSVEVNRVPFIGQWIVKFVMPEEIDEDGCSLAEFFNTTTDFFRGQLRALGVPLSKEYLFDIFEGYAVQTSSDEGLDCEQRLADDPKVVEILTAIMKAMQGVLDQSKPLVGLDSRLSNFCGQAVYTDTFPPLCYYQNQYLIHYPNPTDEETVRLEVARKFEPFGILRRLRFSLVRINPIWLEEFDQALDIIAEPLRSQIRDFFATIPNGSLQKMSGEEVLNLVETLPDSDVEAYREIAALLIPLADTNRSDLLQQIFDLTSMVPLPHLPPREQRLATYRQILTSYLRVPIGA